MGRLSDYDAYRSFLETQAARYRKVFLVLGNHEFYGLTHEAGLAAAHRLAAEPTLSSSLVLLHRTRWDDPDSDLTILGCTLWSAIPREAYPVVEARVSDFKKIDSWTPQKHNDAHRDEVAWLGEQVAQLKPQPKLGNAKPRRLLIATHHAPCVEGTSRPEHVRNPWTPAFATDLLDQDGWGGGAVNVWVFGHTHYSTRLMRNGVRLVSNQRGYVLPGSAAAQREDGGWGNKGNEGKGFDAGLVVAV
ncbi:f4e00450-6914-41d1-ae78-16439e6b1a41 [Thermothielavioides terrestris]|uniref:F4e00450-6914-41d1-ae78-16439e6b1a41 n=1 Tax=Thermothielavioides terrestris TaxID=2587410 RepID=A0A446BCX2_9PEZI|nr:f4e00450-6914-41d1-ae78-16439e6b1a41 [Thermothielavioides terrestris]